MSFWLRNLVMASILAILAFLLYINKDALFEIAGQGADEAAEIIENNVDEQVEAAEPKKSPTKKKSTNAAADGLSKFYAALNPDINENGLRIRNNIVYLPDPTGDIIEILETKKMVTRPYRKSWKGEVESRAFRTGQTLLQKLTEYANKEGVEIVWWLNRDFVVKDNFRINKNIIDTSYQIGSSVQGHFQNGVSVYFCHNQRSVIFIDEGTDYLNDECVLLKSKSGY